MTWLRRAKPNSPDQDDGGITVGDGIVGLRIPIEASSGALCGWLVWDWSKLDPLVIQISVRASNGSPVIERLALRSDVRDALVSPGCLPGISIGPAANVGFVALVFQEGDITLPVIVPGAPLWDTIRATERFVPMNSRSEALALEEALQNVLEAASGSTGG